MSDKQSGPDFRNEDDRAARSRSLSERLKKLDTRLVHQKIISEKARIAANGGDRSGMALAFRLSSEFIAGIVVGAAIGYAIDTFVGTTPWGMIIFLMLGFVAAVLNVLRSSGMVAESGMRLHKVQEQYKANNAADEAGDEGHK
ncbi:MAG: hypothetical protein COC23_08455 [Hyphomicrobiales bacterium]|nr:MAG: hypothetical protein COC23_08455 [Hyphomicrobiales bacterium]